MKRKYAIIVSLTSCIIIVIALVANATSSSNPVTINDLIKAIGNKDEMQLTKSDSTIAIKGDGISITKGEIESKVKITTVIMKTDSNAAYRKVIKDAIRTRALYKLAEDKGLVPSLDESKVASLEERGMLIKAGDSVSLENMNLYIDALGLTEDQYWMDYHVLETQKYIAIERLKKILIEEGVSDGVLESVSPISEDQAKQNKDYLDSQTKEIVDKLNIKILDKQYDSILGDLNN